MTIIDMDKMGEALNTKADIDLNNTGVFSTSEGGVVNLASSTPANASGKEVTSADFFQSNLLNYTTNRILEIPQDIKLELNNGTLTLKAGSKVYVPNGFEANGTTPKFDVVMIDNDIQAVGPVGSFTDKWVFCYRNNGFYLEILSHCFSGSTLPTQTGENRLGYNTTVNKFQRSTNGGAYIDDICSFPICIFSTNSGVITSIDQVFNGFGYIGSTVFVLPGVKVQAPNGRNADGTYNSSVYTISTVLTIPIDSYWGAFDIFLAPTELGKWPSVVNGTAGTRYNSENNYYEVYWLESQEWISLPQKLAIAKLKADTTSPYKITSFEPYTVDSVANSNASNFSQAGRETIVGWGIPDYSAGVSVGTSFTAITDGLVIYKLGTTEVGVAKVNNIQILSKFIESNYDNASLSQMFYVKKEDIVQIPVSGIFYPLKGVN